MRPSERGAPAGPTAGPLTDLRVLDLADEKGMYCGKLWADLGADVLKVERPGGDAARKLPPLAPGAANGDSSLAFLYMNTNKRSVTLDLDASAGQEIFTALARKADIIIETFRPGSLEARGIGFAALSSSNPGLIMVSITPFGQTGPWKHFTGNDLVAQAMGGMMHVIGYPDRPPVPMAGDQAYILGGLHGAVGGLLALVHRQSTGNGRHVDISLQESVAAATTVIGVAKHIDDGLVLERTPRGGGLGGLPPIYPCKDGYICISPGQPAMWRYLAQWVAEVTGNEAILDPCYAGAPMRRLVAADLLEAYITEFTTGLTKRELYEEGQRRRIAVAPLNTAAEVLQDDQLNARGFFATLPVSPKRDLRMPGAPYKLSRTPWRLKRPCPRPGQHNRDVLEKDLRLSKGRIQKLRASGVI